MPHVSWPEESIKAGATSEEKNMSELLHSFGLRYSMNQIIVKSTHKAGNTLDLIFTNNTSLCHDYCCIPVHLSITDHKLVRVSTLFNCTQTNPVRGSNTSNNHFEYDDFCKLNFFDDSVSWNDIISELTLIDWGKLFHNMNINEMYSSFKDICAEICIKYVPLKRSCIKTKKHNITRVRRVLIRKRKKLTKQLNGTMMGSHKFGKLKETLIMIEKELIQSYQSSQKCQEEKAIKAIKTIVNTFSRMLIASLNSKHRWVL